MGFEGTPPASPLPASGPFPPLKLKGMHCIVARPISGHRNKTKEKSTSGFGSPRQSEPSRSGAPLEKVPAARIGVGEVWDVPGNRFQSKNSPDSTVQFRYNDRPSRSGKSEAELIP
jgi:hypothetical protein